MKQTICSVGDPILLEGFPSLADSGEAEIIFKYLLDRNERFGTETELRDGAIEVKL